MNKLTANFSLGEFTASQTATRYGIHNEPDVSAIVNIIRLAEFLQILRDRLNKHFQRHVAISISSGYRSKKLNKKTGGSKTSAHMIGCGADISATGLSTQELFEFICEHMDDTPYDQIIQEFDRWVHVGIADCLSVPRGQQLLATKCRTNLGRLKTQYTLVGEVSFQFFEDE